MSLPEHVRPAERVITPTPITPAYDLEAVAQAPLDLPQGAELRIAGYRKYGDVMLPIWEVQQPVQRTPERDLTPGPLLDPQAQKMLGGGVGVGCAAAGVGWGIGEAASGLGVGGMVVLGAIVVAAKWSGRARTVNVNVHQHATGLFGRNKNTNHTTSNGR